MQRYQSLLRKISPALVFIGFFLLWELFVKIFNIQEFILPAPTKVFESLYEFRGVIFQNSVQTLMTTLVGFLIAIVIGLMGGIVLGSSVIIYESFYPALIAFNSIPKVAFIPILVIWFGIGTIPAICTAFLLAFFPILVNVAAGIATVEPELRDVLRALGASKLQMIKKVGLPRSMPYFFASLKVALTVAFVGSIVSETVASNLGVGYLMLVASSRFQTSLAFACLIVTGALGIMLYLICALFEARMTRWTIRSNDSILFKE
jgi:NitT/TauT family transport system permease protein